LGLCSETGTAQTGGLQVNVPEIQAVLDRAVAAGDVAGVAAAVIGPEGPRCMAVAGTSEAGGSRPVTEHSVFWIASMTKPVASVAAMQLVEQGKLALDAPIGDLLPALAHPQVLEAGRLRPARRKITLRHLLTHTAGFSYSFTRAEYAAYVAANNIPPSGTLGALNMPLLFEPGERWEYGINTDWLGLAVEAASGLKLDAYFQNHIFAPLGMNDTSFLPNEAQHRRRVSMHQREAGGSLTPRPLSPVTAPEFWSAGSGLYSTLADYQKFLRALLNGGTGLLRPETMAEMLRNQVGDLRAGYLPTANPALHTGVDTTPGVKCGWGLGFMLYPEPKAGGRGAGSASWAGLANTHFWVDRSAGLAGMILMQVLPFCDERVLKTYGSFEQAVYAAPQ
jgi:CubicO group peptidase (beta-lactamase class C family)